MEEKSMEMSIGAPTQRLKREKRRILSNIMCPPGVRDDCFKSLPFQLAAPGAWSSATATLNRFADGFTIVGCSGFRNNCVIKLMCSCYGVFRSSNEGPRKRAVRTSKTDCKWHMRIYNVVEDMAIDGDIIAAGIYVVSFSPDPHNHPLTPSVLPILSNPSDTYLDEKSIEMFWDAAVSYFLAKIPQKELYDMLLSYPKYYAIINHYRMTVTSLNSSLRHKVFVRPVAAVTTMTAGATAAEEQIPSAYDCKRARVQLVNSSLVDIHAAVAESQDSVDCYLEIMQYIRQNGVQELQHIREVLKTRSEERQRLSDSNEHEQTINHTDAMV